MTETVLLETAHVLERVLGHPRATVVDTLVAFVREPGVHLEGLREETVIRALLYCRPSRRVSFGDALLWAVAHQNGGEIYTFDARFPGSEITLLAP